MKSLTKYTVMKKFIGYILVILSMVFAVVETNYFGNNLFPKTTNEFICDLIILIICLTGVLLIIHKGRKYYKL